MSVGAQPVSIPWNPAPAQLTMAYSVCRGITRTNAKNFYYAFLVLPKHKRQALCAVYAFMRRCDDIADDPGLSLEERRFKLSTWLAALHRVAVGELLAGCERRLRERANLFATRRFAALFRERGRPGAEPQHARLLRDDEV